eukprot:11183952-Lingulodinium_polyedra.AAC.1
MGTARALAILKRHLSSRFNAALRPTSATPPRTCTRALLTEAIADARRRGHTPGNIRNSQRTEAQSGRR